MTTTKTPHDQALLRLRWVAIEASARALAAIPAATSGTKTIRPPKFHAMPPMCKDMTAAQVWDYACLVGYRRHLSEYDAQQAGGVPANSVKMPTTADEAALMTLLGTAWLKEHAPERLKASAVQPLSEAQVDVRVACVTLDGSTLYIPAKWITDFGIGDDDGETYTLTFKTMTRAEYEALGEFDGF